MTGGDEFRLLPNCDKPPDGPAYAAAMTLRVGGTAVPVIGTARIYVCGITPYGTTHLGHAATFVWIDVLARLLRHTGVQVEVCRNITDIDDDMLEQARRQHDDWRMLTSRQT